MNIDLRWRGTHFLPETRRPTFSPIRTLSELRIHHIRNPAKSLGVMGLPSPTRPSNIRYYGPHTDPNCMVTRSDESLRIRLQRFCLNLSRKNPLSPETGSNQSPIPERLCANSFVGTPVHATASFKASLVSNSGTRCSTGQKFDFTSGTPIIARERSLSSHPPPILSL